MPYRLEKCEPVNEGLRRVAREELESAQAELSGKKKTSRDEAIHEARKSLKKTRAVLRLVRGEMGGAFQRENARLRDIAAQLSEFRDVFAIVGTFDDLLKKVGKKADAARLHTVRAGLATRREESGRKEDSGEVLHTAAQALRKAANQVKKWPLKEEGYDAIAPGLEGIYRKGREALGTARRHPTAGNYHVLRKRVKDHWYHLRLLEGLQTEAMKGYEKSLKELEEGLGNDHNLAILEEKIAAEPAFYGHEKDVARTLSLIGRYRKELLGDALPLAARIYARKPSDLTRRFKRLWDAWQPETASHAAD